jgi:hypothetical protein
MDLGEVGCGDVDWISLAQDSDKSIKFNFAIPLVELILAAVILVFAIQRLCSCKSVMKAVVLQICFWHGLGTCVYENWHLKKRKEIL